MAKSWTTFEHPADLGLEARADSLEELFEALGEGLAEQICPRALVRPVREVNLEVSADDIESLTVDFLARLLGLFQSERMLISAVKVSKVEGARLVAAVTGETYDPRRHRLGAEIKAVTYHQLKVARRGRRWLGRVILDV